MFAYFCRRCPHCKIGFILQLLLDPGSSTPVMPFETSQGNSCPLCHAVFQPGNYFIVQRSSPLGDWFGARN